MNGEITVSEVSFPGSISSPSPTTFPPFLSKGADRDSTFHYSPRFRRDEVSSTGRENSSNEKTHCKSTFFHSLSLSLFLLSSLSEFSFLRIFLTDRYRRGRGSIERWESVSRSSTSLLSLEQESVGYCRCFAAFCGENGMDRVENRRKRKIDRHIFFCLFLREGRGGNRWDFTLLHSEF